MTPFTRKSSKFPDVNDSSISWSESVRVQKIEQRIFNLIADFLLISEVIVSFSSATMDYRASCHLERRSRLEVRFGIGFRYFCLSS